ncbi:MAG: hypothetical protein PHP02_01265 [Eubacteriales bacterium]|nr:hypothetical protein [Eubacteriales bacterium]
MIKKSITLVLVAVLLLSFAAIASAEKYGLGMVTNFSGVADAGEKNGAAQVNTLSCALVLDDEGKIVSALFDMQQSKIQFTAEGKVVNLPETLKTKMELGPDYGMLKASPIGKEWFEQAEAFAAYCVGKTPEEVLGMALYAKDDDHTSVPDVADLKTSVTIDVGDFLEALEKAATNAK